MEQFVDPRIFNRMLLMKLYLGQKLSEEEQDIVDRRKVFIRTIVSDRKGKKTNLITLCRKKGVQVLDQVDERVLIQYRVDEKAIDEKLSKLK